MLKCSLFILALSFASSTASVLDSSEGPSAFSLSGMGQAQTIGFYTFIFLTAVIVFAFWRVAASTRRSVPKINTKEAYKIRKWLFVISLIIILGALAATLPKTPYPDDLSTPDQLIYVTAIQFGFVFSHDPVTSREDLDKVTPIAKLDLPARSLIEFRVSSLDVNHGFAIYGPDRVVKVQTQAMPGYVNRLRVRFDDPGEYNVLCLEYCGAAHHFMRASFNIKRAL